MMAKGTDEPYYIGFGAAAVDWDGEALLVAAPTDSPTAS
jgi:hypothetical protein